MTRTNIDLDDELVERAMQIYGCSTKREVVQLALERLVKPRMTIEEQLAMQGVGWDGDLEKMRDDPIEEWDPAE